MQLAYAIGTVEPVSFLVDTRGTGTLPDEQLEALARDLFPLTPQGIIDTLELRQPIYTSTAAHGHFGRDGFYLAWERTDRVTAPP